MPRRAQGRRITVTPLQRSIGSGGGRVEYDVAIPGAITVKVDDDAVPAEITLRLVAHGGRLAVDDVRLRKRPNGPPITAGTVRALALATYLERALGEIVAAGYGGRTTNLGGGHVRFDPHTRQQATAAVEQVKRRAPVDAARLRTVAAAYRDGQGRRERSEWSRPVVEWVAERLGVSRQQAERLVRAARDAGELEHTNRSRGNR